MVFGQGEIQLIKFICIYSAESHAGQVKKSKYLLFTLSIVPYSCYPVSSALLRAQDASSCISVLRLPHILNRMKIPAIDPIVKITAGVYFP